jgi:2-octaprenyl-6-methoxyphenol hydroxylase
MSASQSADPYDVAISGGGFVGLTLALALARAGVRSAVMEAHSPGAAAAAPRPIALADGSRRILESLGLWDEIGEQATAIRVIHVSDRGRFGFARLNSEDFQVDAFGYVTDAEKLAAVLERALAAVEEIDLFRPYAVRRIEAHEEFRRVFGAPVDAEADAISLDARLLVAADGGRSAARALSGVGVRRRDWGQSAITATVETRLGHENVAYERFTKQGPIALLPMNRRCCGLVWTLPHGDADTLMELDDKSFLESLREHFGSRLGAFVKTGPRTRHRLHSAHSASAVKPRLALVGNAANHLHPVAGQGLNLGLRDAAVLAEVVVEAIRNGEDPGAMATLRRYADWRRGDHWSTTRFTEGVVRLFSNDFAPLAAVRDLGLIGLDSFGFLKRTLAQHAMGLAGRSPRLVRGLPL